MRFDDGLGGSRTEITEHGDAVAPDSDIGLERRAAGAIIYKAVFYDCIEIGFGCGMEWGREKNKRKDDDKVNPQQHLHGKDFSWSTIPISSGSFCLTNSSISSLDALNDSAPCPNGS